MPLDAVNGNEILKKNELKSHFVEAPYCNFHSQCFIGSL